jgi:hypothetical protein
MNPYLKTALICAVTIAVIVRVPAVKNIVIGA